MTILLLLLFIILISFLAYINNRKASAIVFILTIAYCFFVGNGFFPLLLSKKLQANYAVNVTPVWEERNAIVILGGGETKIPHTLQVKPAPLAYARILTAVGLYHMCKQTNKVCTIIISGGDASHTGIAEATAYKKAFLDLKVKDSDLIQETQSLNTFQNAQYTKTILKKFAFDNVILVTSGIHMQRSVLYFSYLGIKVVPIAADYMAPIISLLPLAYNFAISDFILHEYCGMARFHLYNFLNWNK